MQVSLANRALLTLPPAASWALALVTGSGYFVWVINGSGSLVVTRRDKDATWQTTGTLCRKLDWSQRRLLYELQNGLPYRTIPPGSTIDWKADRTAQHTLNPKTSTVTFQGPPPVMKNSPFDAVVVFSLGHITVGIEVLPPADVLPAPAPSLPPKQVSEAALRRCLLDIVAEHLPGSLPLDEETLHAELERRLEAPIARDRVRQVRDEIAPEFKLPPGRPRKSAQ
jgi:hypothetical protein